MPPITDEDVLRQEEYADGEKLEARRSIYAYDVEPFRITDLVVERLPAEAQIVYDVGCGTGAHLKAIREARPDLQAVGIDLSFGILAGLSPDLVVASARQLPFDDASADAVLGMHMLYHLADPEQAVVEMKRVLRPGGVFLCSTNGSNHLASMYESLHRGIVERFPDWQPPGALHAHFDSAKADDLLPKLFASVETVRLRRTLRIPEAQLILDFLDTRRRYVPALPPEFPWQEAQCQCEVALHAVIARDGYFETQTDTTVYCCT